MADATALPPEIRRNLEAIQGRPRAQPPPSEPPPLAKSVETVQARLPLLPPPSQDDGERKEALKRLSRLANLLGPRYAPELVRLDRFEVYDKRQAPILERLLELVPKLRELAELGEGLVFFGATGTGKDHLLAAMLYAAAKCGIACSWLNGQDLYGTFRDRMDTGEREEDLIRQLAGPQVLAISDPIPSVGQPSPYNLMQLYRLLDRRYRALKSTWVSMNALSVEDADAKLSAPVFDRLRESAQLFPCFWPSYRERPKRTRKK